MARGVPFVINDELNWPNKTQALNYFKDLKKKYEPQGEMNIEDAEQVIALHQYAYPQGTTWHVQRSVIMGVIVQQNPEPMYKDRPSICYNLKVPTNVDILNRDGKVISYKGLVPFSYSDAINPKSELARITDWMREHIRADINMFRRSCARGGMFQTEDGKMLNATEFEVHHNHRFAELRDEFFGTYVTNIEDLTRDQFAELFGALWVRFHADNCDLRLHSKAEHKDITKEGYR